MRARHLVFHVRCFSCAVCNALLTKGDQFGMRESSVYCRLHYDIVLESPTTASTPLSMNCQYSQYSSSPNGQTSPAHSDNVAMKLGPSSGYFATAAHSMAGLPQAPRQKGRPRKRKPKDIEAMTANLGEWKSFKICKIWTYFVDFPIPVQRNLHWTEAFVFLSSIVDVNLIKFYVLVIMKKEESAGTQTDIKKSEHIR